MYVNSCKATPSKFYGWRPRAHWFWLASRKKTRNFCLLYTVFASQNQWHKEDNGENKGIGRQVMVFSDSLQFSSRIKDFLVLTLCSAIQYFVTAFAFPWYIDQLGILFFQSVLFCFRALALDLGFPKDVIHKNYLVWPNQQCHWVRIWLHSCNNPTPKV